MNMKTTTSSRGGLNFSGCCGPLLNNGRSITTTSSATKNNNKNIKKHQKCEQKKQEDQRCPDLHREKDQHPHHHRKQQRPTTNQLTKQQCPERRQHRGPGKNFSAPPQRRSRTSGIRRAAHCTHCSYRNFCTRHRTIRLLHRDSLKPSMWINRHIQHGYRPLEMPWSLCIKSIFEWNNETLNVWSHLLGFIYFTWVQATAIFVELPAIQAPFLDYMVICSAMFCCQICMLCSALYHTFGCHSERSRKRWLRADLTGVAVALLGLYLSGIYTSFYHFPDLQRNYMLAVGLVCLTISLYTAFRSFSLNDTHDKHENRIGTLHFLYIGMALIALWPTWHWIQLYGGLANPHVQRWLPNLFTLFTLFGVAFAFYATLIPERLFPGRFDIVGCSHQWWHVLVFAAMLYWHRSGMSLLSHYHTAAGGPSSNGGVGEIGFGGAAGQKWFGTESSSSSIVINRSSGKSDDDAPGL